MIELKHIVYKITNILNEMYYIGKHSTTTPYDMKNYWGSNTHLNSSIKRHGKKNFKRETLFVFDIEEEAFQKEAELMPIELVNSGKVYNFRVGGEGGFLCSEETRKRISGENNHGYGKHRSSETKKKISIGMSGENHYNYGKHLSEEQCKKISLFHKGKAISQKHKKQISEANKGKVCTKETRLKIGKGNKGKVLSDETKKKISIKMRGSNNPAFGKHFSEEHKKKLSDSLSGENHPMFGKHQTEETRKKISKSKSLSIEIIERRREDIRNIPHTRGWWTALSQKWGIGVSAVGGFLRKYASDLV